MDAKHCIRPKTLIFLAPDMSAKGGGPLSAEKFKNFFGEVKMLGIFCFLFQKLLLLYHCMYITLIL